RRNGLLGPKRSTAKREPGRIGRALFHFWWGVTASARSLIWSRLVRCAPTAPWVPERAATTVGCALTARWVPERAATTVRCAPTARWVPERAATTVRCAPTARWVRRRHPSTRFGPLAERGVPGCSPKSVTGGRPTCP